MQKSSLPWPSVNALAVVASLGNLSVRSPQVKTYPLISGWTLESAAHMMQNNIEAGHDDLWHHVRLVLRMNTQTQSRQCRLSQWKKQGFKLRWQVGARPAGQRDTQWRAASVLGRKQMREPPEYVKCELYCSVGPQRNFGFQTMGPGLLQWQNSELFCGIRTFSGPFF